MERLLALFLAATASAYGGGHEFDRVVSAIEEHYGVKRTQIPLIGAANLLIKVARPAGARGFKLAVFEDLPDSGDWRMEDVWGADLHPLAVARSSQDDESTYILAGEVGRTAKVLIVTFERNEATVMEVAVNFDALLKMMAAPDRAREIFRTSDR